MKRANPKQTRIPATLPTERAAFKAWEEALATVEELEKSVEDQHAVLGGLKEELARANQEKRRADLILREVRTVDRQEKLDAAGTGDAR